MIYRTTQNWCSYSLSISWSVHILHHAVSHRSIKSIDPLEAAHACRQPHQRPLDEKGLDPCSSSCNSPPQSWYQKGPRAKSFHFGQQMSRAALKALGRGHTTTCLTKCEREQCEHCHLPSTVQHTSTEHTTYIVMHDRMMLAGEHLAVFRVREVGHGTVSICQAKGAGRLYSSCLHRGLIRSCLHCLLKYLVEIYIKSQLYCCGVRCGAEWRTSVHVTQMLLLT